MLGSLTVLRAIGLIVAVALAAAAVVLYRKKRLTKNHLLFSILASAGLAVASLKPDAVDGLSGFVLRPDMQAGRILSLLILAVLFQAFIILRLTSRFDSHSRRTSRLIEELTVSKYLERCSEKKAPNSILIAVPAYNEADTIADILREIPQEIHGLPTEVLVVVDGSTDDTLEVVESLGHLPAVNLINQGAGAAQRVSYRIAVARNARVAVTMDADGQHQPSELPRLVEPILKDEADIVVGSRVLGANEDESFVRDSGRHFYSSLISLFVGHKVTDCSSSFRAIRTSWISRLDLRQDRFPAAEILIESIQKGARHMEVPIVVKQRRSGESKMPPSKLTFGWKVFRVIVGTWWGR